MWYRPESTRVQIPLHFIYRHIHLFHPLNKLVKSFFTLAPAHYFPNSRRKNIHGGYSFAVVVHAHIKRLYLRGIAGYDNRFLKMLFNKVTLVFALQIDTPIYVVLKFFLFISGTVEKNINSISVCDPFE